MQVLLAAGVQLGRRPRRCYRHRSEACRRRRPQLPATQGAGSKTSAHGSPRRWGGSMMRAHRRARIGCSPTLGATTVISEVVVPYLVDLGERWEAGARRSPGAFRDQPDPRPAAGARPRLGRRRRPARPLSVPERGASRSGPDLLWDRPSRPRLAHHLPGRRHPAVDPDRSRGPARTEPDRAGGDQVVAASSARPRGSNRNAADRHRGRGARDGSPTSSAPHSSTPIPSPPPTGSRRTYGEPLTRSRRLARGSLGPAGLDRDRHQVPRVPVRVRRSGIVDHDRMVGPRPGTGSSNWCWSASRLSGSWRRLEIAWWNTMSSRWCSSVSTTSPIWRCS